MARLKAYAHPLFDTVPKEHHGSLLRAIESIALRATESFGAWLEVDPTASAGFAQHYGIPSEILDFSRSLTKAIGFAVDDPECWQEPRQALVAALDVRRAVDRAIVVDLSVLLDWARRPAEQEAYGFFHRTHIDLKSRFLAEEVGLTWYQVTIRQDEAREHSLLHDLIDVHQDAAAGALQLVIDELAAQDGGWPLPIANYLADTIAPAPFIMRADYASGASTILGQMVSAEQAGFSFDKEQERELNRRLWSQPYPQGSKEEGHRALVEMRAAARAHQRF